MIEICEIRIFWIRKLDSRDLIYKIRGVKVGFTLDSHGIHIRFAPKIRESP